MHRSDVLYLQARDSFGQYRKPYCGLQPDEASASETQNYYIYAESSAAVAPACWKKAGCKYLGMLT